MDVEVKKKKTHTEISLEKYIEIREEFLKLSPKDIIKNDSLFAMDAATIVLSFTNYDSSITYSSYALNLSDETTTRQNLLGLVRKILEIAKVKIQEIN